jgi:hypothetical protein
MWHRRRNYIDFIQRRYKHESTDRLRAGGTQVPPNFKALDDGRVGRNI